MRIVRNKGYGQNPVGISRLSPLFQASLGGLGNSYSTNRASGRWSEDPWFHRQYSMGRSGNRLSSIRGLCSCAANAIKEDQEGVAQEEQDVIDRYYFSRYGRNNLNLIRYGERSCFLLACGEVSSPKSTISLYLLSTKKLIKTSKNKIKIYYFIFLFYDAR